MHYLVSLYLIFCRVEKTFDGKLVGADRSKDLAVLKVDFAYYLWIPIRTIVFSPLAISNLIDC